MGNDYIFDQLQDYGDEVDNKGKNIDIRKSLEYSEKENAKSANLNQQQQLETKRSHNSNSNDEEVQKMDEYL